MAPHIFQRVIDRLVQLPVIRSLVGLWFRRSMIRSQQFPRERIDGSVDGFLPQDLVDLVLGFRAENPDRKGCPPGHILRELAARRRPTNDPWYTHLWSCSNCYRQTRAIQQRSWRQFRSTTHETVH